MGIIKIFKSCNPKDFQNRDSSPKKNMIIYKLNLVLVYLRINYEMQEENDEKNYFY